MYNKRVIGGSVVGLPSVWVFWDPPCRQEVREVKKFLWKNLRVALDDLQGLCLEHRGLWLITYG
jgi:hypothetical protein